VRLRYLELVGKPVVTSDDHDLGRVADVVVEPHNEMLCVTGLLVGPSALLRRISFKRGAFFRAVPPRHVPWTLVTRIDTRIHLRLDYATVEAFKVSAAADAAYEECLPAEPRR
jgi:sporulation protein YlmC with PRC-barrel domain